MAPTDTDTVDREDVPRTTQRDALTVLKTAPGFFASKQIIARGGAEPEIRGFNAGMWFHTYEWGVSNIVGLSSALTTLETMPDCFVIRGAPRRDLNTQLPQRRQKSNFQTPPGGRMSVLIDFDKIQLPAGVSLQQDIAVVCEHLVGLLPAEFHKASYHWQLSSSAGLRNPSVVSLHLWFWLDRPIPDALLKSWGKHWNAATRPKLIDLALFNDVQPHYTAAPMFDGMEDPFPVRSGLARKAVDEVALELPRLPKTSASRVADVGIQALQPGGGFETILAQIGDHEGGHGFHTPIIRAAASYAASNGRDGTDIDALYEVIRARVLAADHSKHDAAHVENMASPEHIIPAIQQALVKYAQASPRRKARQLPGVRPHFTAKPLAVTEASAMLENAIWAFFGQRR